MCDYSLEAYRSRPARLGERYETHRFESHSIGFIAPGDPSTAVCMAYDTKLRLEASLSLSKDRSAYRQMKTSPSLAWRAAHITTACGSPMERKWRCKSLVLV